MSIEVPAINVTVNFNTVATRDVAFAIDPFTGDGSTTEFVLSSQCKANSQMVFVNGILARGGAGQAYTIGADQQTITFATAPTGGTYPDEILVVYAIL